MERSAVVACILRIVGEASPAPMRGAKLAEALRREWMEFRPDGFECRNLRQFISHFVPEVMEAGKAGTDILYRKKDQQQPLFELTSTESTANPTSPLQQLLEHPRVWKTFASPDSFFKLYISPSLAEIRVLYPKDRPEQEWCEIKPISSDELKNIAVEFIKTVAAEHQGTLSEILDEPKWWIPYFDLLTDLGLKSRWVRYRRRRIAEAFERAVLAISSVQERSSKKQVNGEAPQEPPQASQTCKSVSASVLRKIALLAVERLTESELRSLNLPLGYVVDALQR